MSSDSNATTEDPPRKAIDKGKGKDNSTPIPHERTPLLHTPSSSSRTPGAIEHGTGSDSSDRRERPLWYRLTLVFSISLAVCVLAIFVLSIIIWTRASKAMSSNTSPEFIMDHVVSLKGPDSVDVLNVTETGGLWVNVTGRIGIDAGYVVDVHSEEDDSLFDGLYKSIVRWGIHRVGSVTVDLDTLSVSPDYGDSTVLVHVSSPLLEIPLSSDPFDDDSWLTKMSAVFFVEPTNDTARIVDFAKDAWREGSIQVKVHIPRVSVHGGGILGSSWRNRIYVVRTAMRNKIHMPIPHIPGLPDPDRNSHFPRVSDLVTLLGFKVSSSSSSKHLSINAEATVINPAPDYFKLTTPHLPFFISLPTVSSPNLTESHPPPIPIAAVHTLPFQMTHPNISLSIEGHVLPLASNPNAFPTLSAFISNYLSASDSPILISSPYLQNFSLETIFPAPPKRPHILRDVTIHDMKVKPLGSKLFASGTIFARIVLPKGMDLGLQVNKVLPDVLVFDGEVPPETKPPHPEYPASGNNDSGSTTPPPPPPLPDPLPSKAFGHIRPTDWIDAMSVPEDLPEDDEDGAAFAVSAKIVDVPLEVLPGRQKEFSNFVSKVIFGSDGALAGILGTTYVSVDVWGIPGPDMELGNLPFQGVVKVGKWGNSVG